MLRFLIPVSVAILAVVFIERGEGDCNMCAKGTEDSACVNNTYTSGANITENDSYCKNVKAKKTLVSGLCKIFPKGYKIRCDKVNVTCEGSCSAAVATGINNLTPVLLMAIVLFCIAG